LQRNPSASSRLTPALKIVEKTSYTARHSNLFTINFENLSFQAPSADTEIIPLDQEDQLQYRVHQVRRVAYLDNITCFLRFIWRISSRPSSIPKEHHDRIFETAEIISDSFRAAYVCERGVLWKDGVDDFAGLWAEIKRRQESRSLKETNEEADYELPARLFEIIRPIAVLVLPGFSILDRALAYPLPDVTHVEIFFFQMMGDARYIVPFDLAPYPEGYSTHFSSALKVNGETMEHIDVVVLPREIGEGVNGRTRHDVDRLDSAQTWGTATKPPDMLARDAGGSGRSTLDGKEGRASDGLEVDELEGGLSVAEIALKRSEIGSCAPTPENLRTHPTHS
ncbi:hypothetical protein OF83DRAFT_1194731, partial [Amylostereum chailletii]